MSRQISDIIKELKARRDALQRELVVVEEALKPLESHTKLALPDSKGVEELRPNLWNEVEFPSALKRFPKNYKLLSEATFELNVKPKKTIKHRSDSLMGRTAEAVKRLMQQYGEPLTSHELYEYLRDQQDLRLQGTHKSPPHIILAARLSNSGLFESTELGWTRKK